MIDSGRYEYVIVKYESKPSEHIEAIIDSAIGSRKLHSAVPLSGERILLIIEYMSGGRYTSLEKDMEEVADSFDGGSNA